MRVVAARSHNQYEQGAVQCEPGLAFFAESNSEPICFVCFDL
jgi:hypothetical protein